MAVTATVSLNDARLQAGAYLTEIQSLPGGKGRLVQVIGIESSTAEGVRVVLEDCHGVLVEGGGSCLFSREKLSPTEVVEGYRLVQAADGRPPMRASDVRRGA